jgi:hypothetical protein
MLILRKVRQMNENTVNFNLYKAISSPRFSLATKLRRCGLSLVGFGFHSTTVVVKCNGGDLVDIGSLLYVWCNSTCHL